MTGTLNFGDLYCLKFMWFSTKNIVTVNLDIVECHVRCTLHVLWMGEVTMNLKF